MLFTTISEHKSIEEYLLKRWILEQYKKAKNNLLSWNA